MRVGKRENTKWSSRRLLNILSIIIYLHSPAVDVLTGKKKISAKNELNLVLLKKKNSVRKDWNIKQKHLPPFCCSVAEEQRRDRCAPLRVSRATDAVRLVTTCPLSPTVSFLPSSFPSLFFSPVPFHLLLLSHRRVQVPECIDQTVYSIASSSWRRE